MTKKLKHHCISDGIKLQKEKHSQQSMEICNNNKENTGSKKIYIKGTHAQHMTRRVGPTPWSGLCLTHILRKISEGWKFH